MASARSFRPDWISAPGGTIDDLLEERGWTQAELAERLDFTPKHVNDLVSGRAPISPQAATRLSLVLGSTADFWLVREAQYQAAVEHSNAVEAAAAHEEWLDERGTMGDRGKRPGRPGHGRAGAARADGHPG